MTISIRSHRRWTLLLVTGTLLAVSGCKRASGPRELLDAYFSSAIRQDYAATYACYDEAYHARIPRDEYVRHRREASLLQQYRIVSLQTHGDSAKAQVLLTFAPSAKLHRTDAVTTTVQEDLVRQRDGWRIKVW